MNIFVFVLLITNFMLFLTKFKKKSIVYLLLLVLLLLVLYPYQSLNSAKDGINLWFFVVVPSLLPFFIINDMLISLKVPENISRMFSPLAKYLFNTSGYGAYVFIMSLFSGYPAGAKITAKLIESKKITVEEGERILSFSSTSGPLFIIGAVGTGMLNNSSLGYFLFISHILGAITNGFVYKLFTREKNIYCNVALSHENRNVRVGEILSKSISDSLITCGFIGGYIILFSVIITLLENIDFFVILNLLLTMLYIPKNISNYICTLLQSSIEISNGCKIISNLGSSLSTKMILISFIISFSGFSIIGQVTSILSKTKININKYIFFKLTHGIFSALICWILLKVNLLDTTTFHHKYTSIILNPIVLLETYLTLILCLNLLSQLFFQIRKH
ncbi:hypothetical protein Q428_03190 [Fervidicella metallireducens AeB]|uniref:Sporulation integral membrane protein YlbJ n=1 Tax=Fervidicella metallireducens AeB TaxID=1403537 RepID=A0A017RY04_9CLOT|nr:sporulation integral membrane protein YlbJ [Fervidicella metallireducens]EYE89294.1 hypothetical protein Q428_03190 [Fervidicella metallireducens AeB]